LRWQQERIKKVLELRHEHAEKDHLPEWRAACYAVIADSPATSFF
jgi:hypothetical protein